MKIKMELLSDAIFGNGMSVPGGEDISVLHDAYGFPYYKGGTLKGIFREELIRYLDWTCEDEKEREGIVKRLLGESGSDIESDGKLIFSDFTLSDAVRYHFLSALGEDASDDILNAFTHMRSFTKINENGVAQEGSLRSGRCVNKGLCFYGELSCKESDKALVREVLSLVKWIGSMRNRGFGKVKISMMN